MIHFVLHDPRDTVAVVVVEGVKAGMALNGWIMDEDRMVSVDAAQDIPIGHKVALQDMAPGDTVLKYGIDIGKVVANIKVRARPCAQHQDQAVVSRFRRKKGPTQWGAKPESTRGPKGRCTVRGIIARPKGPQHLQGSPLEEPPS